MSGKVANLLAILPPITTTSHVEFVVCFVFFTHGTHSLPAKNTDSKPAASANSRISCPGVCCALMSAAGSELRLWLDGAGGPRG